MDTNWRIKVGVHVSKKRGGGGKQNNGFNFVTVSHNAGMCCEQRP